MKISNRINDLAVELLVTQNKGSAVNVDGQSIPGEDSYDPGHSSIRNEM